MKTNIRKSERGQILILLTLAFVVILGFTALAIDGGMVFADRRYDQSAADSIALSGAGKAIDTFKSVKFSQFKCSGNATVTNAIAQAQSVAISRAAANNFTIDADISDKHGVNIICTDNAIINGLQEKYMDVKVMISSKTETSFAHLLFGGELRNTVEAVVRIRPLLDFYGGYAIVALDDPATCNSSAMDFKGNITVIANPGGIFSNSGMTKSGSGSGTVHADSIHFRCGSAPSGNFTPTPTLSSFRMPRYLDLPIPNCASLPDRGSSDGGNLQPGRYSGIIMKNDTFLNPGLYCMYGQFDMKNKNLTGDNVTLYFVTAGLNGQGNGSVQLTAPANDSFAPALQGVLMYMKKGNTSTIELHGTNDAIYVGTIYAPDGQIDAGGNSTIGSGQLQTQLIAKTILTHGTPDWTIQYHGTDILIRPAQLDLFK